MIIWQGFGFLAVLIPIVVAIIFVFITPSNAEVTDAMLSAIFVVSAIVTWFTGKKLNSKPGKVLIDSETQEKVELKNKHTLFWIPMEWIAILWVLMAIVSLVQPS